MISFVWTDHFPFISSAGGSETYTIGHLHELKRRDIPARLILTGPQKAQANVLPEGVETMVLPDARLLSKLDDTIIFVLHPRNIPTRKQSYAILHAAPQGALHDERPIFNQLNTQNIKIIATSKFMADFWQKYFHLAYTPPHVYPFAAESFSQAAEPSAKHRRARLLFAGRPTPDKGIYTLLASLQMPPLLTSDFDISCVLAKNNLGGSDVIGPLLHSHPQIHVIDHLTSVTDMMALYAQHDIVVMPSSNILWKEAFGMIAVEAQHAGCRVVASRSGGLPETDCGSLLLVRPDDPLALARGIRRAIELGPLPASARAQAKKHFTVAQSIDQLLQAIS
jgi:D-inositol-3-phosphate glycosyltransferase